MCIVNPGLRILCYGLYFSDDSNIQLISVRTLNLGRVFVSLFCDKLLGNDLLGNSLYASLPSNESPSRKDKHLRNTQYAHNFDRYTQGAFTI